MTSSRPGQREGLTWLLFIGLCFSPCLVLAEQEHSIVKRATNTSFFDTCQPWICSCYMDGTYYEPNDRWKSKTNNCTEYLCQENGYYQADTIGVWYNGQCRYVNDTWTTNTCFNYKVVQEGNEAKVRLLDGGCLTEVAGTLCIPVGDRIEKSCNTYECQIVGTCYTLVAVSYGCIHGSSGSGALQCKMLNSIWNDACVVFQCLPDAETSTKIRIHSHTEMLWPRGNYALLEPETGCPAHVEELWDEGERIHWSEAPNMYSDPFNMKGNHTETFMEHHFCTHEDYLRDGYMPLYHSYWDEGRYCILKYNGSCPKNFTDGYVKMIDFTGDIDIGGGVMMNVNGSINGTLPDGTYWENSTLLEFCCRYDGELKKELILPANRPFVLFMAENETECQEVRAMEYHKEFFSFGDVDDGFERELNGSLPRILTSDNNTMIHLCHYIPMDCGCYYETGVYVALNSDFTTIDGCVTYRCIREDTLNINVLQLITGACANDGACVAVGTDVPYGPVGDSCYTKTCRRKENAAKEFFKVYYAFDMVPSGCRQDSTCEPLGTVRDMGCYETTCQIEIGSGEPKHIVTKEGCDYGGACVPLGNNVTDNECVTLQCGLALTGDKTEMKILVGGCKSKTTCYPLDGTWQDDCVDYTCKEFNNGTVIKYYALATKEACADENGTCHDMGSYVNSTCWTYQCVVNGVTNQRGLTIVGGGCRHKGSCYVKDEIWTNACSNLTCSTFDNSTYFRWSIEYVNPACDVGNGTCIDVGTNIDVGCTTYECKKGDEECGLIPVGGACHAFDGSCVPAHQTWKSGCTTYQCNVYDDKIKLEPVHGGCSWNHTCYDEGQSWNVSCKTYECQRVENMFKTKMVAKGCQDGKGGCMGAGEVVEVNCNKMQCFVTDYSCRISIVEAGCNYNGKCYAENETMVSVHNKCRTLMCNVTWPEGESKSISLKISTVENNCYHSDTCFNTTMYMAHHPNCYKLVCNSEFQVDVDYTGTMCRSDKGTCYAQNSVDKFETTFDYNNQTWIGSNCTCGAQAQMNCNYRLG